MSTDNLPDDPAACNGEALDHVRAARMAIDDCIDAAKSTWLGDDGAAGVAFKKFPDRLKEIERDLFRIEGVLLE